MATLPSTFGTNHQPTAVELARVASVVQQSTNIAGNNYTSIVPTVNVNDGLSGNTGWHAIDLAPTVFTKYGDASSGSTGSDLLIFMTGSFYLTANPPATLVFSLKFDATHYVQVASNIVNVINVHHQAMGLTVERFWPAGVYALQAYVGLTNASSPYNGVVDNGDTVSWFVAEIPH